MNPHSAGGITSDSRARGSGFGTWSSHILSFLLLHKILSVYWRKYVHLVLVYRLGLSLPMNCVVRISDCSDMTIAVYGGRKATTQQQLP